MRKELVEKVKDIIEANYCDAECGIFASRNICGDDMTTIYEDKDVQIDICYDWGYFEIFGLTPDEFAEIKEYYNAMI